MTAHDIVWHDSHHFNNSDDIKIGVIAYTLTKLHFTRHRFNSAKRETAYSLKGYQQFVVRGCRGFRKPVWVVSTAYTKGRLIIEPANLRTQLSVEFLS